MKNLLIEINDGVQIIKLNRPERLNAWTREMALEIREAISLASSNDKIRVIILTGAGRGFCAGADMEDLNAINKEGRHDDKNSPYEPFDQDWPLDFQREQTWFPSVPKPIIAAINGPAAGLGLIISMWCDMRFAARSAIFSTAFSKRGLIAEHGISWVLPRLVGMGHAMDMVLSARKISAEEAERIGFVNKVFDDETFMEDVINYANTLARDVSPRSMKIMKKQLWQAMLEGLDVAVNKADIEMNKSFTSNDFKEGIAHFLEKRSAKFSGN